MRDTCCRVHTCKHSERVPTTERQQALRDSDRSWWIGDLGDSGCPQENLSQLRHDDVDHLMSLSRRNHDHDRISTRYVSQHVDDICETATVRPSVNLVEYHIVLETGTTSSRSLVPTTESSTQLDRDEEDVSQGLTTVPADAALVCLLLDNMQDTRREHMAPPDTQSGQSPPGTSQSSDDCKTGELQLGCNWLTPSFGQNARLATERAKKTTRNSQRPGELGLISFRALDSTATVTSKASTHDRSAGGSA